MQTINDYDLNQEYERTAWTAERKSALVTRVYTKLTLSILALALIEALVFALVGADAVVAFTAQNVKLMGGFLLLLCIVGPMVGNAVLARNPSRGAMYALLGYYVLLESAILLPILAVAALYFGTTIIWQACGLTVALFLALSSAVFITRKDFSFLRSFLVFTGFAAIILIVLSLIMGFELGMWFTVALIFFACGYILYDTSNMLLYSQDDDDIICTISLFTSVMTLFFYILRLLMELNRR